MHAKVTTICGVAVEIVKSYVASTGVCHHVARSTTHRPKASVGGHGDIGHDASVDYFFAHVLSSTGHDVTAHVNINPSPATKRNTLLQRVCDTQRTALHTGVAPRSTTI